MSDVGLNSNIYDISSKYLGILNRFLVEANYDSTTVSPELTEEVQTFLHQLSDPSNMNFQIQMVEQIIQSYLKKHLRSQTSDAFLRELTVYFDRQMGTNPEALRRLAYLTEALNEECDNAYSRMRFSRQFP